LASTLIHSPELIFLDEPTAGIDPVLRRKFWDHFQTLKSQGHTLFVTTQYVGEAAYCDFVGVMRNGRLLMVETPEMLRYKALNGHVIDLRTKEHMTVETIAALQAHPLVKEELAFLDPITARITVEEASTAIPHLLDWCAEQGVDVESINEFVPPFDDVFVMIMEQYQAQEEASI
jgi:ABC-2 type transport system ATP-binding protein